MNIHPTAILAKGADVHPSVKVGPYSVIGANVTIGENTVVGPHCFIDGYTTIGSGNVLSPFVSLGCPPQDIKFAGEKTFLKIGDGNHFREFVTVHLAEGEGNSTVIGDKNLFMAYVHVAHNCHVGSNVIMANNATLAGHVHVGDRAVLGGFAGIHQFCQVGQMVMIGGMSKIVKDVPPFVKIDGNPARVIGLNDVGMRRNGVPRESHDCIRKVLKLFFRSKNNLSQAKEKLMEMAESKDSFVLGFLTFVNGSKRGIYMRGRDKPTADE
jgi:UDP-N-acetylglucosamine acyltransferase